MPEMDDLGIRKDRETVTPQQLEDDGAEVIFMSLNRETGRLHLKHPDDVVYSFGMLVLAGLQMFTRMQSKPVDPNESPSGLVRHVDPLQGPKGLKGD